MAQRPLASRDSSFSPFAALGWHSGETEMHVLLSSAGSLAALIMVPKFASNFFYRWRRRRAPFWSSPV
jgi:hypothetical protein